jgi:hypothetical protein
MKILRPSVMKAGEWFKERDPAAWRAIKQQALVRDEYTCTYCRLTCRKCMQVNHIGAEDDHRLDNLETVCSACHSVLHLGVNAMYGVLTVFACQPEVVNMAAIVCVTRSLVAQKQPWTEIERAVLARFARPGGRQYSPQETVAQANRMLASIVAPAFRGYLPQGLAVLFHEEGPWQGFPEAVWKWQCLPGARYRKDAEARQR